jgi:hypothetical protein
MDALQDPIFPKQALGDRQKNLEWYKQCIEAGVSISNYKKDSGIRAGREEKISNVNLFADIVDKAEVESAINPYNLSGKFPDTYKNYPVSNSNLNLLFGEERKRLFNPISYVVNSDIINTEQDVVTQKFKALLQKEVMSPEFDKDMTQKAILNLDKWKKFTYQDEWARMSNQIIQFFLHTTDIKEQWSKNFEDLLIQGEEIASIDIVGGNLVFERLSPLDVFTFRSGDSYKIEDSDWISISKYMTIGEIIDGFGSFLNKVDHDYLEEVYTSRTSGSSLFPDGQLRSENWDINKSLEFQTIEGRSVSGDSVGLRKSRDFDDQGNIRVVRTLWKGQRKIGILEYKDNEGRLQKKHVPEQYKPKTELGEKVKWEYISEWYEGTKIGRDIYVKYGPRPIQFRDPDNPSICHPGIVGNILNTNSGRAKSLLSYMKPYQLLYNFFMYRLQQDFIKYQGHIAKMNLTMKPDKWTTDKWMYYMQQFGIMYEDPFNEGQEGAATGKLAGGIGHNTGGSVQIGDFNLIQTNMMMLDFLEQRIADISGVTPQRKGAIQNRETVGGVERSVQQSSNNTEKYFSIHDNFRVRCLKTIVETAKIAWKDKKEKRMFILDDGTKSVLDFNGDTFKLGVYGVAVSSSSDATNMMNELKGLSQHFMQNGGSMSAMVDLLQTKDPTSLKRKMEQYEDKIQLQQEESEKRQIQVQEQQMQQALQIEQARMDHEVLLKEMEINGKLKETLLNQEGEDNTIELEKLRVQEEKIKQELQLKSRQLTETEKHNRNTESIARQKPKTTSK